jgi:hypothetical protein
MGSTLKFRLSALPQLLLHSGALAVLSLTATGSWADTCRAPKQVGSDVLEFRARVGAALLASARAKGDGFAVEKYGAYTPVPRQTYCGNGSPEEIAVNVNFRLFLSSDDVARAVAAVEAKCRLEANALGRERQIMAPDKAARIKELDDEARALRASGPRGGGLAAKEPGYDEFMAKNKPTFDRIRDERQRINEEHMRPFEAKEKEQQLRCADDKIKAGRWPIDQSWTSVRIKANGYELSEKPSLRLGVAGNTQLLTTKVHKIDISFSDAQAMQQRGGGDVRDHIARFIDLAALQALLDGRIPAQDNSAETKALFDSEMKAGEQLAKQRSDLYSKTWRDIEAQNRATASGRPAPAPSAASAQSAPSAAPAAAQSNTAARPAQPATPAPAAPALPANPAQVLENVNKLKGLFGR